MVRSAYSALDAKGNWRLLHKETFFYWIIALVILAGLGFWYYVPVTDIAQEIQFKSLSNFNENPA